MLLELKAKHFKGTEFISINGCGCAIEKAAKEIFPNQRVAEGVDNLDIGDTYYIHRWYDDKEFLKDKEKAKKLHYSNAVVNKIRLIKQKIVWI